MYVCMDACIQNTPSPSNSLTCWYCWCAGIMPPGPRGGPLPPPPPPPPIIIIPGGGPPRLCLFVFWWSEKEITKGKGVRQPFSQSLTTKHTHASSFKEIKRQRQTVATQSIHRLTHSLTHPCGGGGPCCCSCCPCPCCGCRCSKSAREKTCPCCCCCCPCCGGWGGCCCCFVIVVTVWIGFGKWRKGCLFVNCSASFVSSSQVRSTTPAYAPWAPPP